MITEFKINVADVPRWRNQPDVLQAMLAETYSQVCVAYSVVDPQQPEAYANALLIGESLFPYCSSIFPIHVYQPGTAPADHIVFILQIRALDRFVSALRALGDLFADDRQQELQQAASAFHRPSTAHHFPELQERLAQLQMH